MKEAVVQEWVKQYLTKEFGEDLYMFKVPQGQYSSRRGIPDLVCCVKGVFLAIEVKTEGGNLTKLQAHELRRIGKAGGHAYTIYGKDEAAMAIVCRHVREGWRGV